MKKIKRITWERVIYIALIVIVVGYGILKDSESATKLLNAITEAFSILIKTP